MTKIIALMIVPEGRNGMALNPEFVARRHAYFIKPGEYNLVLEGPESPQMGPEELRAMRRDALRYRYLRTQHWSEAELCVLRHPKQNVRLGAECPSLERLDALIDAILGVEGIHDV